MIIPKKIEVAGITYRTVFNAQDVGERGRVGEACHLSGQIKLGYTPSGRVLAANYIHEVLHAVNVCYNAAKLDEETVDRLANGLHQVIEQIVKVNKC